MNTILELQKKIEQCSTNKQLLTISEYQEAIHEVIARLNNGTLRIATQTSNNGQRNWKVHAWLKQAILLYFQIMPMQHHRYGEELSYYDKIPVQQDLDKKKIRLVPPAIIRYGSHVESGAIVMPSFINIGAYVGKNTLIDTWATVGSCAQIGSHVHLSGGVGIGGVLEPVQAAPVIIEDHAFIGSRVIIVEGILIQEGAVIGAGVVLTASTPIIDVSHNQKELQIRGKIPAYSVVIPGSRIKKFPAGSYATPAALIIGKRNANTDKKLSLEQTLRNFEISI